MLTVVIILFTVLGVYQHTVNPHSHRYVDCTVGSSGMATMGTTSTMEKLEMCQRDSQRAITGQMIIR